MSTTRTTKKRRFWSSKDISTLKAMARQKKTAAQIARTLKRTPGATRQKAFAIGLSLETRPGMTTRHHQQLRKAA